MFYRKKPVVIQAVRWDGVNFSERPHWVEAALDQPFGAPRSMLRINNTVLVYTLEGKMIANPGDYIIKGIKGELYPCKPDIFVATYEAVPDDHVAETFGPLEGSHDNG